MSYYVDKSADLGIIISNYTYEVLADAAFNSFENFRVILLGEIDKTAYECICSYSTYDPSDLSKPCNIAKYELGTNINFDGNNCDAGNNYPIGGWLLNNVELYKNSNECLYGLTVDNLFVPNDDFSPFNFRYQGVAVIATDVVSGEEKCIYIDPSRWYKIVYKADINITFETVKGIDKNFLLSFTNQPQFE